MISPTKSITWMTSKTLSIVCGCIALGVILWILGPILWPFLLGALIAYILHPGVEWLVRHKVPRGLSVCLMMLLMLFSTFGILFLEYAIFQKEAPRIQEQITQFLSHSHETLFPLLAQMGFKVGTAKAWASEQFANHSSLILSTLWKSVRASGGLAITCIGIIFMLPLVIYSLLYDWHLLKARFQALIPRSWLPKTNTLASEFDTLLSQYLRGQLLVMILLALYYAISLSLIGLDLSIPIGVFTGFAIVIPYIGYFTGFSLALIAAFLQWGGDWHLGAIALIYAGGQILEGSFLSPRLVGERLGLHPLAALFSLLVFGQLLGFLGILIALPSTAMLAIALREFHSRYLGSRFYKKCPAQK